MASQSEKPDRPALNIFYSHHPPTKGYTWGFYPWGRVKDGGGVTALPGRLFTYKSQDTSCFSYLQACVSVSERA